MNILRNIPTFLAAMILSVATLSAQNNNSTPGYRIQDSDILDISVYDEPDLSVAREVDATGQVQVPLLGSVTVAGMTLREAEHQLEQLFVDKRFLRAPDVSLSIKEHAVQEYSVFGEVSNPGRVSLPAGKSRIDIVEAISRAGGFTSMAHRGEVEVTRDGRTRSINVGAMISGDSDREKFYIVPEDVIRVPERLF